MIGIKSDFFIDQTIKLINSVKLKKYLKGVNNPFIEFDRILSEEFLNLSFLFFKNNLKLDSKF